MRGRGAGERGGFQIFCKICVPGLLVWKRSAYVCGRFGRTGGGNGPHHRLGSEKRLRSLASVNERRIFALRFERGADLTLESRALSGFGRRPFRRFIDIREEETNGKARRREAAHERKP